MPELPEVETTRRGIEPLITGKRVKQVIVRTDKLRWPIPGTLGRDLKNQYIDSVERRAKYIFLNTAAGSVIVHLGMTGSLRVIDSRTPVQKHEHIDVHLENGQVLRYKDARKFGAFLWTRQDPHEHKLITRLGPEPLSNDFNADYLFTTTRKRKAAIKTHIMNQHVVVGIGNIYASEALFKAGINPNKAAHKVSKEKLNLLVKTSKQTLRAAIKQGGTTLQDYQNADGAPGYFSIKLKVYGKQGLPCPECAKPISSRVIGQRNSFYCTHCQS
ncbi:MAG: bifunctional DNA-formamidopyrimidine glycosylase/DNA-(apurinic or apyrimidinic site) lyase [Gammaproteobacteria bacterium]|nr:bifunctional DNA-formamidopyrimidine glycosylase/DNA-(apurinic or apyrimidinic site) lyase [Gammaproteobacteria bacterium]NNM14764.1 bifunctional DNA-formamidopyrimidine glycosylase/DNA-(apurinic or apyrimidinic site) lyase [Gammaproteobacteria bacterium]